MITPVKQIIYPEGDSIEVNHKLRINEVVDLNGIPLSVPLSTSKMIAYRVCRISTQRTRNEEITSYHLELMNKYDLREYVSG